MTESSASVLYVLADFPVRSERFLERELRELQRAGTSIRIATLRRPRRRTKHDTEGDFAIVRSPAWWSPRLWASTAWTLLTRPADAARHLRFGWSLTRRERSAIASLRLAILSLYLARRLDADRPAVTHAHFASAPTTVAMLASHWWNRSWGFSVHAHDLYAEPVDLVEKVQRCTHVVACSEVAADDVRRRLPRALHAKVHAIHHGLDLSYWAPGKCTAVEVAEVPLLLAVGRLAYKKGFAVLIEACALLRAGGMRFQCEIIGEGAEEDRLRAAIARRGLGGVVTLRPWVPPRVLRERYRAASVLVVPSVVAPDGDRDNVPNVVLEALACELPVVASALPALARVLGPSGAACLVAPAQPSALARALERILSDGELHAPLRARGRALVESRFDVRPNVGQLRALLVASASATDARGPLAGLQPTDR